MIDLTQTTLKEWALKEGLDADIQSMTQAEKAMLRLNYVMAQTGIVQGDFADTAETWANQVKMLKQNFQELGAVLGGIFINAFGPAIRAMNNFMAKVISFAKTVADALGAIFGWTVEITAGGGSAIADDLIDAADAAEDLADGTGSAAGNAAKTAKALTVLPFDELNQMNDSTSSGGSGGGGGGGGGGAGSAAAAGGLNVQLKRVETTFDKITSQLDTLDRLGTYVQFTLLNAMRGINWDSIYTGAANFGTGLADFLNALISPSLFKEFGKTVAGAMNTAIYAALAFGSELEWAKIGTAIGEGITAWADTFDFASAGQTWYTFHQGILDLILNALGSVKWDLVATGIADFLKEINFVKLLQTIVQIVTTLLDGILQALPTLIQEAPLETALVAIFAGFKFANLGGTIATLLFGAVKTALFGSGAAGGAAGAAGGTAAGGAAGGLAAGGIIGAIKNNFWPKDGATGGWLFSNKSSILEVAGDIAYTAAPLAVGGVVALIQNKIAEAFGIEDFVKGVATRDYTSDIEERENMRNYGKPEGYDPLISAEALEDELSAQRMQNALNQAEDYYENTFLFTKKGGPLEKLSNFFSGLGDAAIGIWDLPIANSQGVYGSGGGSTGGPIKHQIGVGLELSSGSAWANALKPAGDNLVTVLANSINGSSWKVTDSIKGITTSINNGLASGSSKATTTANNLMTSVANALNRNMSSTGASVAATYSSGLNSKVGEALNAGANLRNHVANGANTSLYSIGQTISTTFKNGLQSIYIPTPHVTMQASSSQNIIQKIASGITSAFSVAKSMINWYATGGLATGASVVGIGERGDEAILPLTNQRTMSRIASAITNAGGTSTASEIERAVERGVMSALMRNPMSVPDIYVTSVLKTDNETLARSVQKGQARLNYRNSATAH